MKYELCFKTLKTLTKEGQAPFYSNLINSEHQSWMCLSIEVCATLAILLSKSSILSVSNYRGLFNINNFVKYFVKPKTSILSVLTFPTISTIEITSTPQTLAILFSKSWNSNVSNNKYNRNYLHPSTTMTSTTRVWNKSKGLKISKNI